LCRRDHGLTWAEFEALTLAQLEALDERRAIEIRHARHDAAFIVSAIYNASLGPGVEPLSPFDFLPGFEPDPEEREREQARKAIVSSIRQTLAMLPTPEAVRTMRDKIVTRLKAQGYTDAEDIIREAYPNL
jgi:hypothetical protein